MKYTKENHISNNPEYLLKQLRNLSTSKTDKYISGETVRIVFRMTELDDEVIIFKTLNNEYWISSLELGTLLYSIKDYDLDKAKELVIKYISGHSTDVSLDFYEIHIQYKVK